MKLLITGSFGNEDIGDDAMLTMHLNNIYNQGFKKCDIHLLGNKPKYMSWYFNHPIENCHSGFKHLDLNKIDRVLFTGGGTINTRKESRSLAMKHLIFKIISNHKLPVFMSGQTIGPLGKNKEHDDQARYIINYVDVLTVRDSYKSKYFIDLIGAKPKKFYETNDDAVNLPLIDTNYKYSDKNTIAFNISNYTSDTKEKMDMLIKICEKILNKYKVLLIPHHPIDQIRLEMIRLKLNNDNCRLLDIKNLRGIDVKSIISKCKYGIGGRYHFLVFCISAGIPCVSMAMDEYSYIKQYGFLEKLGLEKLINNDIIELENVKIPKIGETMSFKLFNEWINESRNKI